MRPIVINEGKYRIFAIVHPERPAHRPHVFAMCSEGRARIWLEPKTEVDTGFGTRLGANQLSEIVSLVEKNRNELLAAWHE